MRTITFTITEEEYNALDRYMIGDEAIRDKSICAPNNSEFPMSFVVVPPNDVDDYDINIIGKCGRYLYVEFILSGNDIDEDSDEV